MPSKVHAVGPEDSEAGGLQAKPRRWAALGCVKQWWWTTLPSKIKQLPVGVLIAGLCVQIILLVVFFVLARREYENNVQTMYISPQNEGSNCRQPKKAVSGTYYLSSSGIWSTDTSFKALETLYEISFTDYMQSSSQWRNVHAPEIAAAIKSLNASMATSDITSNLLKVISKSFDLVKGELTLTLVSDPSSMLGRTSQSAKLLYSTTNSKHSFGDNCGTVSSGTPSTTILASDVTLNGNLVTMTFDSSDLSSLTFTTAFTVNTNIGASTSASITFDLRSFLVAAAVNAGIIQLSELETIGKDPSDSSKGVYYMLKYAGMEPITCLDSPVCNLALGSSQGGVLPYLMHHENWDKMTNSTSRAKSCTCTGMVNPTCSQWDLELVMFFYDGCFVTTRNSAPHTYYTGGYNALAVRLNSVNNYINDFYYTLSRLHCQGSLRLAQNPGDSKNFRVNAPVSLVQDYYYCSYTKYTVWSNTFSNAYANTDLIKEALVAIMIAVAVVLIKFRYHEQLRLKKEHVDMEEHEVLRKEVAELREALKAMQGGSVVLPAMA